MPVTISSPVTEHPYALNWENAPDGELMYAPVGPVALDNGEVLGDVTLAFQRWGTLSPDRDNVVLALHALTGDSHVTGPADDEHEAAGWWDGLIGPGCAVDTDQWCVVSPNVLGGCRGSTGPSSTAPDGRAWGSRFPRITILDQVRAEVALTEVLGISRVTAVVGGSMGGARALEWAVGYPDRVRSALVLAVGARATADQIGIQSTQIAAIEADPHWQGGDYHGSGVSPTVGMGIARRIAHLSYRAEIELDERFGNSPQGTENPLDDGRYAVESYLEHQSAKLSRRFDPGSYVTLTDALNNHDVGRGRGGVEAALRGCPVPVVVGGIDSDRLYPLRLQAEIAEQLGNAAGGLHVVSSDKGHDGFLTEADAIGGLLRYTIDVARDARR
ncbi:MULTISPECIES: homoserine O-acetyltransferase MetX [Gordonia]|nr:MULTISPECIES: homoserine O-acetyltransferase [Gordonia]